MIFNLYGSLLQAAGRAEEAKDAYLRALKYNPVDDVLMKLMMYYDGIEIDNKKVEEYSKDIIRYSYNPENIALAYRFLGYWYYKYNDFETTTSVYLLSLLFEDHITAWMDFALMDDFINLKEVDAIARLKEMDIPVGANPKLFEILPNLIDEAGKIRDENFK
ncbi:MAG: hypothetical protein Q4P18_08260 [Methanobrevibacter sp.]|uniref:hypothetical protein n=1 Tax=Methanobrevibacter sp. TaxID=66852 RepID=UPI0026DF0385|nr:hypothetical protein [Methanobrevibacter sp.]MDO5849515.1 hypothetical protein [Methanobrevibacter sp.]